MNTVKITNSEYVRDLGTKAVLNTDVDGLTRYKSTRRQMLRSQQEQVETKERLETIEREMVELKTMIHELGMIRNR